MKPRVMYIERKADSLNGEARIGRVSFSKTGKTLHYGGKTFKSIKGGYKANYYEEESGDEYWISGCKKRGGDRLYKSNLPIDIDDDVREEYWTKIRGLPDRASRTTVEPGN
ncbi:MAG: hypothetical protein WD716_05475 [Fimbriimonadaceae bacterium]